MGSMPLRALDKWKMHWMQMAVLHSKLSKDPSTQVGAAVADGKRLLGLGYNGFPPQIHDDQVWLDDRPTKYRLTIHAEYNAIINAYQNNNAAFMPNATLYATQVPCGECAKLIVPTGIRSVIYMTQESASAAYLSPDAAADIFERANISFWHYTGELSHVK